MKRLLLIVCLLCVPATSYAHTEEECKVMRQQISEYGIWKATMWALKNGYTWKQIREARKECKL